MATNSLPQPNQIIEAAYSVAEPMIGEPTHEFEKALKAVRHMLSYDQHEALWNAAMQMLNTVKEDSFKAGWSIRAQV